MGKRRTLGHGAKTARHPTSLQFFGRLLWLDGRPLEIEEYRRRIFSQALDEVGPDGHPRYSMVVSGRGKKNNKTLDLVLAALYVLVIRRSVQGSDGLIAANDAGQALDDMGLARKVVACNPILESEVEVLAQELRLRDGSATLKILPARDVAGAHGKSAAFIGFDEIHGYRDWSLIEALSPDPTRHTLTWITSYASIYNTPGAPLYDLMQIGKAGSDPKMLFSWYSGDFTTDANFAELPPEERANPSMASWLDGAGYLAQQRARLPSGRYRRLHLNLPGSPQGAAFDQGRVLACVVEGRRSLPPDPDRAYRGYVDMSGGSSDDATLCIAHADGHKVVVDVVEKQAGSAPFDPRKAVEKFVGILREYRVREITMDAYAGETFRRDFDGHGIDCRSYSGSCARWSGRAGRSPTRAVRTMTTRPRAPALFTCSRGAASPTPG
jgi:hypothetical protein